MWQVMFYKPLLFLTNIFFIILQLVQDPTNALMRSSTDMAEVSIDGPSSILVSYIRFEKRLPFSVFLFFIYF